jgi:DNA-directed RNA polymerase specialized sigma subunit
MNSDQANKRCMVIFALKNDGMLFKDIAKIMKFSPSRASQLYQRAIRIQKNGYKN